MNIQVENNNIEITCVNLTGNINMITLKNGKRKITLDYTGIVTTNKDLLKIVKEYIIDALERDRQKRDKLYDLFGEYDFEIIEELLYEVEVEEADYKL